jgi:hypothetical protein
LGLLAMATLSQSPLTGVTARQGRIGVGDIDRLHRSFTSGPK